MALGGVTIVVDERDDLFSTQAALQAHRPEDGRITVQPTPASSSPAALAHDVLYALGKRLAPGPNSPDVWLDSVNAAWLAAAAWGIATGMRHVVVTRTHLLTPRRLDQLLAWREITGVQLTLLWQKALHGLPPALARVEHLIIGCAQLEAALAEPGPAPARPYFPRGRQGRQPLKWIHSTRHPPGPCRPTRRRGCHDQLTRAWEPPRQPSWSKPPPPSRSLPRRPSLWPLSHTRSSPER
ncbi:hypothetical protein [Peterkaempfera sp. SMS 1(5)a]|uniref:hypothetical protein n=1 Tax=Peterkaempfera podocarpi TaxID=3232308 RepID=UPI003670C430